MADDVRALDAQSSQQRPAIGSLLGDAERLRHARAAGVAAPVVAQQAVVVRQRRLGAERRVGLGEQRAVDEHHRLARAHHLVLQHGPIDPEPVLQFLGDHSYPSIVQGTHLVLNASEKPCSVPAVYRTPAPKSMNSKLTTETGSGDPSFGSVTAALSNC